MSERGLQVNEGGPARQGGARGQAHEGQGGRARWRTTPTKKKAKTDALRLKDPVTEAPVRRAKKRAAARTPKKAKKAKTRLGAKVNKKFGGARRARRGASTSMSGIKSVEDGGVRHRLGGGEQSR